MKAFYVRPNSADSCYVLTTTEGETTIVKFDWSAKVAYEGTSVSSVAWSVDSGTATTSSTSLSSGIAQAQITTSTADTSVIKVTATLADGQIDVVLLKVVCKAIPSSDADYA